MSNVLNLSYNKKNNDEPIVYTDSNKKVQYTKTGYPKINVTKLCFKPPMPEINISKKCKKCNNMSMPMPGGLDMLKDFHEIGNGIVSCNIKNKLHSNKFNNIDTNYDHDRLEKAVRLNTVKRQYIKDMNEVVAHYQMYANVRRPKTSLTEARYNYMMNVYGTTNLKPDRYFIPMDPNMKIDDNRYR